MRGTKAKRLRRLAYETAATLNITKWLSYRADNIIKQTVPVIDWATGKARRDEDGKIVTTKVVKHTRRNTGIRGIYQQLKRGLKNDRRNNGGRNHIAYQEAA